MELSCPSRASKPTGKGDSSRGAARPTLFFFCLNSPRVVAGSSARAPCPPGSNRPVSASLLAMGWTWQSKQPSSLKGSHHHSQHLRGLARQHGPRGAHTFPPQPWSGVQGCAWVKGCLPRRFQTKAGTFPSIPDSAGMPGGSFSIHATFAFRTLNLCAVAELIWIHGRESWRRSCAVA